MVGGGLFGVTRVTMASEEKPYGFPFPPYSIQIDFMDEFYRCLRESRLGIFESPTGTGKSLSIICATLSWLKEHHERRKTELKEAINKEAKDASDDNDEEDDWFASAVKKSKENAAKAELRSVNCVTHFFLFACNQATLSSADRCGVLL